MARTPFRGLTPARALWLAAAVGAAVTLISVAPVTSVAYRSVTLHVAIETAATLIALLASALLFGRFLRAPMRSDLVLAGSLLLLGLTDLCFAVIPWIADGRPGSFDTWAPIAGRLLGAAGLAVGALMPSVPVRDPRRSLMMALAAAVIAVGVITVLAAALAPSLPAGIDPGLAPDPSGPDLVGEPSVLVSQALGMALYGIAAFGFARRAERTADELMAWLAAASTLAAFSRLNYFLFPSLYSAWVYTGDFLRLGFYGLILAGALREIAAYQRELAEIAVLRERRRIARELHDGVAQELVFIKSQAGRLRNDDSSRAAQIRAAADRALDESRHAILTLARPVDVTLDTSVAQAAEDSAGRAGIDLKLELATGVLAPDAVHETLMRIVREAMANAVRHGGAKSVTVRLANADGLQLSIEDDGSGLSASENNSGFGLVSMRERAHALGGDFQISERAGGGVCVKVRMP